MQRRWAREEEEAAAAKMKAEEQATKVSEEAAAAKVKAEEQAKKVAEVDIFCFTANDLNRPYARRQDVIIHDRGTYWDSKGIYFISWQKKGAWVICCKSRLAQAKAGDCGGRCGKGKGR